MRRSKRLVLDRGRRDDAAHEIDHDCARSAGPHVEPEKIHLISCYDFGVRRLVAAFELAPKQVLKLAAV